MSKERFLTRREFLQLITFLIALITSLLLPACTSEPTAPASSGKEDKSKQTPPTEIIKQIINLLSQASNEGLFAVNDPLLPQLNQKTPAEIATLFQQEVLSNHSNPLSTEMAYFFTFNSAELIDIADNIQNSVANNPRELSPDQITEISQQLITFLHRGLINIAFDHRQAENLSDLTESIDFKITLMTLAYQLAQWLSIHQDPSIPNICKQLRHIGDCIHLQLSVDYQAFTNANATKQWEGGTANFSEMLLDHSKWLARAQKITSLEGENGWKKLITDYYSELINLDPTNAELYQNQQNLLTTHSNNMPFEEIDRRDKDNRDSQSYFTPDVLANTQAQMVEVKNGNLIINCKLPGQTIAEAVPLHNLGLKPDLTLIQLFQIVSQVHPVYVRVSDKNHLAIAVYIDKPMVLEENKAENFNTVADTVLILTEAAFNDNSVNVNISAADSPEQKVLNTQESQADATELKFARAQELLISKLKLTPTEMMSVILSEHNPQQTLEGIEKAIEEGANFHYRQIAVVAPQAQVYKEVDRNLQAVGALGNLAGYEGGITIPLIPDRLITTNALLQTVGILDQNGKGVYARIPGTTLYLQLNDLAVNIQDQKSTEAYFNQRYPWVKLMIILLRIRPDIPSTKKYPSASHMAKKYPRLYLYISRIDQYHPAFEAFMSLISNPENHSLITVPAIALHGNERSVLPYIPGHGEYLRKLASTEQLDGYGSFPPALDTVEVSLVEK